MRITVRYISITLSLLLCVAYCQGQTLKSDEGSSEEVLRQSRVYQLVQDLGSLEDESKKLDSPIARAFAEVGIADTLWGLNKERAQNLLRGAYKLTWPEENDRDGLRNRPIGSDLVEPTALDRARSGVRRQILEVASRDRKFVSELTELGAKELGREESALMYSRLARQHAKTGDFEAAGRYIAESVEAEPTRIDVNFVIYEIAAQDREAADRMILQYIDRLRTVPLTPSSAGRVFTGLDIAVFAAPLFDPMQRQVKPSSPAVIKLYLTFVMDVITALAQNASGNGKQQLRGTLFTQWNRINNYAPELRDRFLALEGATRFDGQDSTLPEPITPETLQKDYEELVEKATQSGKAADLGKAIDAALWRQDFAKARKLIDLLSDEKVKAYYLEQVNLLESISMASKGEFFNAQILARKLTKSASVLRAYSSLIERVVKARNKALASDLAYEAVSTLKKIGDPELLPQWLSRLTTTVSPVNSELAFELLGEMVDAVNRRQIDPGDIDLGFYTDSFVTLAPVDEIRVRQNAEKLKDRLRRIVALSALYRWKAKDLAPSNKDRPNLAAQDSTPL